MKIEEDADVLYRNIRHDTLRETRDALMDLFTDIVDAESYAEERSIEETFKHVLDDLVCKCDAAMYNYQALWRMMHDILNIENIADSYPADFAETYKKYIAGMKHDMDSWEYMYYSITPGNNKIVYKENKEG